ncbi:MAG: hypothetical protein ABSE51_06345 [Terracidiphilus sp.]|jgi:hypothetical protein
MHNVSNAIETLVRQGLKIEVDPTGKFANVYTVYLPSGKYELNDQHLIFLERENKLNIDGIEELDRNIKKQP